MKTVAALIAALAVSLPTCLLAQRDKPQESNLQIQIDVVGKAVRSKGTWAEIQSRNFLVTGDASESDLRLAASELELLRNQFAVLLPKTAAASSVLTRAVVMRDIKGSATLQSAADMNYLVLPAGEKLSRDLIRAYVPLLMRDGLAPMPLWFQEGLAEYFSTYRLDRLGDSRVVKLGLDEYKNNVSDKKLIPLAELFAVNADSLEFTDKEARKLFTAESAALVTYLVQSRRLNAATRFLSGTADGKPMLETFRKAFNMSLPTFEENFKYHVKLSRSRGWTVSFSGFTVDPKKHLLSILYANEPRPVRVPTNFDTTRAETNETPMRILTDAEAEYYRGDLLLHSSRPDEAESFLLNAVRLDSRLAAAHASLGSLQTEKNLFDSAHQSLAKAIELDPRNFAAYYYSALLLRKEAAAGVGLRSHRDVEKSVKANLKKAVELAPGFVDAVEMLAGANLTLHEDLKESAGLLMEAMRRSPGRQSLLMTFAQVAAEGGQKPMAGWMLQRVLATGSGSMQLRQDARDLLYSLDLTNTDRTAFGDFGLLDSVDGTDKQVAVRLSSKQIENSRKQEKREEKDAKVIRALLTKVDCSNGLTLYLRLGKPGIDERTENVHTDAPASIEWVTDSGFTPEPVECGPMSRNVAITYRPQRKGLMMGQPLVVQFITQKD